MVEVGAPSETAMLAALARIRHRWFDAQPWVFDDPFALLLVGPEWPALAAKMTGGATDAMREATASLAASCRYAEDRLRPGHHRQYIVLGAGLDSFAWRRPDLLGLPNTSELASFDDATAEAWRDIRRAGRFDHLRVFEVDRPSTQAWKRERIRKLALPTYEGHVFTPIDFEVTNLSEGLTAAGFDWEQPTLFSCLGVSVYLTIDAIEATLRNVASCPEGSEIVLSYVPTAQEMSETDRALIEVVNAIASDRGEPFRSQLSADEVGELVTRCGLRIVDHPTVDDIIDRYFADRADGLRPSTLQRLVTAAPLTKRERSPITPKNYVHRPSQPLAGWGGPVDVNRPGHTQRVTGAASCGVESNGRVATGGSGGRSRLPSLMPYGWFRVADGADVPAGEACSRRYFGRELVVWRDEAGGSCVMDAVCPHLGAHLGDGRVEGDAIRCPYHGWKFDRTGACVEVPYASHVPRAGVGSYPTVERNGCIFAWYHPSDAAPTYDIREYPERDDVACFSPILHRESLLIHTIWQEIAENIADRWHFSPLHGESMSEYSASYERALHRVRFVDRLHTPFGITDTTVTYESVGPGLVIVHSESLIDVYLITTLTPVEPQLIEVNHGWFMRPLESEEKTQRVGRLAARGTMRAFRQDQAIWEKKTYHARPLLLPEDEEIRRFRRWANQFYDDGDEVVTSQSLPR